MYNSRFETTRCLARRNTFFKRRIARLNRKSIIELKKCCFELKPWMFQYPNSASQLSNKNFNLRTGNRNRRISYLN